MLITKLVKMKWSNRNINWYKDKGYIFTKYEEEFEIKVEDLSDGSGVLVDVECDGCNKLLKAMTYQHYKRFVKEDSKYYCLQCAMKLYGGNNARVSQLKNSVSFFNWCYDNLTKEEADEIMLRWDENLNVDKNGKKISPNDVSYASNKGYWFKCLNHPEHKSEQKNINNFVGGVISFGNLICNQCNSISITHPYLIKYLVNKEDSYKYSFSSNKKIPMQCPDCGYEKMLSFGELTNRSFACPRCSDGIPYPEKFMFNILEQLEIHFKFQLTKTIFKWCKNYRYDFYLNDHNCIIETHGIQHYEKINNKWGNLKDIQQNDIDKEQLAKENNINNYIVVDCRESNLEWIKNSIMNSKLPTFLNFKEENIKWLKCHELACNSMVKVVCNIWEDNINSTKKIADKLNLNRATVVRYLKQGVKLGWCDYNPKEEMAGHYYRRVICLTTGEIYNTIKEAQDNYNIDSSSISKCCKHKQKYAGKHPITGEKMIWQYLN